MSARRAGPFALCALALLAVAPGAAHGAEPDAADAPHPLAWTALGAGLEHAALAEDGVEGHAFRFRPADVALRIVPAPAGRAPVAALAPSGDAIAVNASFFDPEGRPMGRALSAGRSVGGARIPQWAAFVVDGGRARIVPGAQLGGGHALAVQGFPRLVVAGAVPRLKPQRARRTAVCVAGGLAIVVVTRASVDATDFARLLAARPAAGGLGCDDALNLDGGSSTQLLARWNGFEATIEGGAGVPNALLVQPKPR